MSKIKLNLRKSREVIFTFCEGETELLFFYFLKTEYWKNKNSKLNFKKAKDIKGFSDFKGFEKKYLSLIKGVRLTKNEFKTVKFLFVIDNDLKDSIDIESFLKGRGHLVQLCSPNTEGMILNIVGKPQTQVVGDKDFRAKCKSSFYEHFGHKAHKWLLNESKVRMLFKEEVFKKTLPVMYDLFTK